MKKSFLFYSILSCASVIFCSQPLPEEANRNMTYSSDMLIEDVERLKMVKQNIALCTVCIEKIQEREAYVNWCDNQPRVASYDHYYLVNLINSGCTHALPSSTHKNLYDAIINNLQLQWLKDNPNLEVENATNTEEFIEAFSQDIHGYKKNYIRLYRDYLKNTLQFDQQALQSLKVQEYEISMAIKQKSYNEMLAHRALTQMDYAILEEQTAKMHIANMQKCHSQIIAQQKEIHEQVAMSAEEESTRIIIKNNRERVLKNNASTLIQSAMRQKIAREQVTVLRQIRDEQHRKDEYAQEQNILEIARHERIEQQKLQKEQEAETIRQEQVEKTLQLKAKQKADAHARNKKIKEEIEAREKKEREDSEVLHACMKENGALQKTSTPDQSEKGIESVQNIFAHKDSLVPQAINYKNALE